MLSNKKLYYLYYWTIRKEYFMKNKRKIKWRNLLIVIIFLICSVSLIVSIVYIIKWNIDKVNTKEQIQEIDKIVEIEEIPDTETTEIIVQPQEPPKTNHYLEYIKYSFHSLIVLKELYYLDNFVFLKFRL